MLDVRSALRRSAGFHRDRVAVISGKSELTYAAFVVSGAPIHGPTALAARDLLGAKLYQLYGQTECTPAAFMGPVECVRRRRGIRAAARMWVRNALCRA
jgi:long-subunit acyl-CoA synthetase (AMP-forming)